MKTSQPKLEDRTEQHYVGIRTQATLQEMASDIIPTLHSEVMEWLKQQGVAPTGAPFLRFYVINMEDKLDIEIGWPVATPLQGSGRITAQSLPAGRYASLIYTGLENGVEGNGVLIDWAKSQGIEWDRWDTPEGDAFRSRYEAFLTEPDDEPDPSKWETEVAIMVAG